MKIIENYSLNRNWRSDDIGLSIHPKNFLSWNGWRLYEDSMGEGSVLLNKDELKEGLNDMMGRKQMGDQIRSSLTLVRNV